jgi:hypothetical protein
MSSLCAYNCAYLCVLHVCVCAWVCLAATVCSVCTQVYLDGNVYLAVHGFVWCMQKVRGCGECIWAGSCPELHRSVVREGCDEVMALGSICAAEGGRTNCRGDRSMKRPYGWTGRE